MRPIMLNTLFDIKTHHRYLVYDITLNQIKLFDNNIIRLVNISKPNTLTDFYFAEQPLIKSKDTDILPKNKN